MESGGKKGAFSTMEILTVVAILMILAAAILGVGRRIKTQAQEKLARSTIEVIVTALGQYYDYHGSFPFDAEDPNYFEADFAADVGQTVNVTNGNPEPEYWSSEALYYFLSRSPNSKRIISAIEDVSISNKDEKGVPLEIKIPDTATDAISLVRFIDPWGKSLRYTYTTGDNFPVVTSAGSNGDFDAKLDNISSR